jgi:glycosyltransferase involved in cell wall biosynthesis
MNVTYDISVLGAGMYQNRSRTGVSRTVECLYRALLNQKTIDLSFSASWSLTQNIQTIRYVNNQAQQLGMKLLPYEHSLCQSVVKLVERKYPSPGMHKWQELIIKAALWPADMLFANPPVPDVKGTSVYHSTFYPLPRKRGQELKRTRVLTIYDLIPVLYPKLFKQNATKLMHKILASIHDGDRLIAISESTKSDLCDYTDMNPERVDVTHLAASENFYPCLDQARISEVHKQYGLTDSPYLLSLCTLEPRKNIDQTIRSFIALVKQQGIQDLKLVLVGTKGWDFDKIFAEIKGARELKNRIVTTGYVPDEDLAPLYSAALMFVYPSLYEGFGLPPLEAMQCGVPVITSNTSSLPEVVGDAGIMVSPKDGEALSQAMLDLYRDSAQRNTLSAQGLLRSKLFSWKKCADQTTEAYRRAMQQQS